jgi:hypothetical protein
MQHSRALALPALLRWQRWLQTLLTQANKTLSHPSEHFDAEVTSEDRLRFDVQETRGASEVIWKFWMFVTLQFVPYLSASYVTGDPSRLRGQWACVVTSLFTGALALLLYNWAHKCKDSPTMECRMLVICQCVLLTSFCLMAIQSIYLDDELIAHRSFIMRFFLIYFCTAYTHMPLQVHLVFVTAQMTLTWMFFHWMMDLARPIPIMIGMVWPIYQLFVILPAQKSRWLIFSSAEQEKRARLHSEGLMETLRGVRQK